MASAITPSMSARGRNAAEAIADERTETDASRYSGEAAAEKLLEDTKKAAEKEKVAREAAERLARQTT
eukprot:SAG31_NODE_27195_length_430_cov_0.622356_2_plen_68_part_00